MGACACAVVGGCLGRWWGTVCTSALLAIAETMGASVVIVVVVSVVVVSVVVVAVVVEVVIVVVVCVCTRTRARPPAISASERGH